jgi:hypothetical protein
MGPDPLPRTRSDLALEASGNRLEVSLQNPFLSRCARLEWKGRLDRQSMAATIGGSPCEGQQHGCAQPISQLDRPEARMGRATKELHRQPLISARALVQQHEHAPTRAERTNEAHSRASAHRDLLERLMRRGQELRPTGTYPARRTFESRLLETPVDRRDRHTEIRQLGGTEFPISEMGSDHDRALPSRLRDRPLEVLEAVDLEALEQCRAVATGEQQQLSQPTTQVEKDLSLPASATDVGLVRKSRRELLSDPRRPRQAEGIPETSDAAPQPDRGIDSEPFA